MDGPKASTSIFNASYRSHPWEGGILAIACHVKSNRHKSGVASCGILMGWIKQRYQVDRLVSKRITFDPMATRRSLSQMLKRRYYPVENVRLVVELK